MFVSSVASKFQMFSHAKGNILSANASQDIIQDKT